MSTGAMKRSPSVRAMPKRFTTKGAPVEERAERRAQQKGRARAADRQHGVVGPASVEAALPAAESERRGLHHEEEEERQPT